MKITHYFATGVSALAMMIATTAVADEFPSRSLTMVVGFNAGGSSDTQGRVLANVMEEYLGQPVNVVNRPGGGGAVAFTQLAHNTEADGYTFIYGSLNTVTFMPLIQDVAFDVDDFNYVAGLAATQNALVTSGDQPFSTFEELLEHGRDQRLTYAQQTALDQAIIQQVAEIEGLNLSIVPTGGGGGMAPLVLGNEVDFAYSGGTHAQYTEQGDMQILAFLSAERSPFYPDSPTLVELGYDFAIEDYRAIMTPAGVPDDVMERLVSAAEYASQHEAFINVIENVTKFPITFIPHEELEVMARDITEANRSLIAD